MKVNVDGIMEWISMEGRWNVVKGRSMEGGSMEGCMRTGQQNVQVLELQEVIFISFLFFL